MSQEKKEENKELTQEQIKEMIQQIKEDDVEAKFILQLETIEDRNFNHWRVKNYSILYGDIIEIETGKKVTDYGKVTIHYKIIIPKTEKVVLKVVEDSDDEQLKATYFYIFSYPRGWVCIS